MKHDHFISMATALLLLMGSAVAGTPHSNFDFENNMRTEIAREKATPPPTPVVKNETSTQPEKSSDSHHQYQTQKTKHVK